MKWFFNNPFTFACKRFSAQRGTTLAAASSFYFVLTVVPMTLILVRCLGLIFGDMSNALEQVFLVAENFFPKMTADLLFALKELVKTALFGPIKLTLINFVFLLFGSLSFVNSLWTGVYLMTLDRRFLSWRNYLRGVVLLGVSTLFVTVLFGIPSLFVSFINFIQTNTVITYILDQLPIPRQFFIDMAIIDIDKGFLLKSDFIALALFVIYFTFAFRWVFKSRLHWQDALISAGGFSIGLFFMKRLFWLYLEVSKHSLLSNYGKAYTLVLGILWIYFSMCLFFLMVSMATELLERRRALDAAMQQGYHGVVNEGEQN